MLASSATSSSTGSTDPAAAHFAHASRPLDASRRARKTRKPFPASWRQISNPIPRFPPVTRATLAGASMSRVGAGLLRPERRRERLDEIADVLEAGDLGVLEADAEMLLNGED